MTEEEHMQGIRNRAFTMDDNHENGIQELQTYKTELPNDSEIINASNENAAPQPVSKTKKYTRLATILSIHAVVIAYFAYATYYYDWLKKNECWLNPAPALCGVKFCTGYQLLILLVAFVYFGLFYYYWLKPTIGIRFYRAYMKRFNILWMHYSRTFMVSTIMLFILAAGLAVLLFFQTRDNPRKLVALTAPCFFVLAGYVFSTARHAIKWRTVVTGITAQFLLGVICIRWEVGRQIFQCLGDKVSTFLHFTDEGSRFVFGNRIVDDGVFAFAILSVIYFFSFFISILYYLGAMQWIVMKLGWILQQMLGTTVCESVNSAANIFLGMSESPLLIRPYIKILTASEIHSIMVSGFATVSGTVLAAYMSFGASPAHLITSSVMAAPAALAFSKLYMPETEESQTSSDNIQLEKSEDSSLLDAAANGASNAIPIVLGISANIIAFVAFITFLNAVVNWFGFLVGLSDDFDFEWIFSKIFIPIAWAIGIPWDDCDKIAKVIATKVIINEFVAYERLGAYIKAAEISTRSIGIATYAICGFGNPSSLGILIGSLSAMAPMRRGLITAVAFRAVIVGTIVCFISASFAGLLIEDEDERALYSHIFNSTERKNITIAFIRE